MDYFKDLQFIRAANLPDRRSYHSNRTFDYYTIQYCHAGQFSLRIDDGPLAASAEPCVFLSYPGAKFTYGNPDRAYHHLYVCFRGPLAEAWRDGGLLCCLRKDALLPVQYPVDFFNHFVRLIALLYGSPRGNNHARAVLLLAELLLRMSEQQQMILARSSPFAKKMKLLAKEINRAPELEWNFFREARRLKISYSYFRHLFEEFYQEPPHHFLLQCRLQKAEALLIAKDLPIGEIAAQCGFQDGFYFSRIFRKYYGISPLNYRKEHLP